LNQIRRNIDELNQGALEIFEGCRLQAHELRASRLLKFSVPAEEIWSAYEDVLTFDQIRLNIDELNQGALEIFEECRLQAHESRVSLLLKFSALAKEIWSAHEDVLTFDQIRLNIDGLNP
jgi:hypothetical protein